MSGLRNRIMDELTDTITGWLVTVFGSDRKATRNLTVDPSGLLPEQSPAVFIEEMPRRVLTQDVDSNLAPYATVEIVLRGFVCTGSEDSSKVQAQLNDLEEVLDQVLLIGTLANEQVSITVGDSFNHAGDSDGNSEYNLTIKYPRALTPTI